MSGWDGVVNVGPVLAHDLEVVGIADLEALRSLGPIEASRRLERAGRHDCTHVVLALEGALRGIRWLSLPPQDRAEVVKQWKEQR